MAKRRKVNVNEFIDSLKCSVEGEALFEKAYREFSDFSLHDLDTNALSTHAIESWLVAKLGLSVAFKLRETCSTYITDKLLKELAIKLGLSDKDEFMVKKVGY